MQAIWGVYSGEKIGFIERISLWWVIKMLNRFSEKDTGSGELLCHGYFIVAKKIN